MITKYITKDLKGKNASENAFSTARRKLIERDEFKKVTGRIRRG